jgi:hypothetical protein
VWESIVWQQPPKYEVPAAPRQMNWAVLATAERAMTTIAAENYIFVFPLLVRLRSQISYLSKRRVLRLVLLQVKKNKVSRPLRAQLMTIRTLPNNDAISPFLFPIYSPNIIYFSSSSREAGLSNPVGPTGSGKIGRRFMFRIGNLRVNDAPGFVIQDTQAFLLYRGYAERALEIPALRIGEIDCWLGDRVRR